VDELHGQAFTFVQLKERLQATLARKSTASARDLRALAIRRSS
jgi:hypothetical protein